LAAYPAARGRLPKDRLFWLALAAGPASWWLLYRVLQPAVEPGWPLAAPLAYLLPALLYPVLEEIVFRGLVQEWIHEHVSRARLGPLSVANLLTSVLFAGMHFINHPPLWAGLVFLPSLVFGYFKERSGGLAAPILLHVFYNAGFVWLFAAPG
jgi:membrane protease YdiL (CAAX protease family)